MFAIFAPVIVVFAILPFSIVVSAIFAPVTAVLAILSVVIAESSIEFVFIVLSAIILSFFLI